MESREILFEKIESKKKEWDAQHKNLKSQVQGYDSKSRIKIEEQIDNLNTKLREVEARVNELRNSSHEVQLDIGDKVVHSWLELFKKIDEAILKLKK